MDLKAWEGRFALQWYSQILAEEDSIHTVEMTAIKVSLKEIHKRKEKRWILYTASQSYMHFIKYNIYIHPIWSQIYDILPEIQAPDKKIILYKVSAHIEIKRN